MARDWGNQGRGGKLGCSYKRTTLIVCSINIVVALFVLRYLYASLYVYSSGESPNVTKYTPDQIKKMEESIRIRRAAKPLQLVKMVKKLEKRMSTGEAVQLPHPLKQKITDEILQRLKGLKRFQNLQSLKVFCSSFEDIFPDEGLVDEGKHPVLENLRELKLSKLHNLKRVWREDYLIAKILRGIKIFEVWDCPCLTTIFPTAISFRNLTQLVVKNSSGMVHLVTISAVINLVHLTHMTIIGCERMKEVVANDENGEGKVISLGKLYSLTLQNLPSLECFSSTTSCSLRFPSLYSIKVEECPQMKIFSKGTLTTPRLRSVSLFRYEWRRNWEGGDLNTTIQKLSA